MAKQDHRRYGVDVRRRRTQDVRPGSALYVSFADNTAGQEANGVTPFQLVHGRKLTTMLDALLPFELATT